MKIKSVFLLLALATVRLAAADILPQDTAVFVQPDPKSHVLSRLKAGNTIIYTGDAPAGWRRVEVSGAFEAYVHNRDITKGLEVREGAPIHAAPKKDAQVIATGAAGDKTELIGVVKDNSDWCQIRLEKKLQGFIAVGEAANIGTGPAPVLETKTTFNTTPPPPVTTAGRAVPITGNTADLPRLFAGRLVLARRAILNPNPLYDHQLVDVSGRRFAYVDTKRLVLTDKIEIFLDRNVTITGTVRNTVDGKDLVIAAESMVLK